MALGCSRQEGIRFVPKGTARSHHCRIPIFIPTIPRFLDADLDRYRYNVERLPPGQGHCLKSLHATYIIRYLILDNQKQRDVLLPELSLRNRAD